MPKLSAEATKPGRYQFVLTLSGVVEATTLEEAHQKLDFAIDEEELRKRKIVVLRSNPDVRAPLYGMFSF